MLSTVRSTCLQSKKFSSIILISAVALLWSEWSELSSDYSHPFLLLLFIRALYVHIYLYIYLYIYLSLSLSHTNTHTHTPPFR